MREPEGTLEMVFASTLHLKRRYCSAAGGVPVFGVRDLASNLTLLFARNSVCLCIRWGDDRKAYQLDRVLGEILSECMSSAQSSLLIAKCSINVKCPCLHIHRVRPGNPNDLPNS